MKHGLSLPPEIEIAGQCLSVRLRMLNRLVTNLYDDALRPFGLRASQMNLLVAIAARGPLRGVDLASMLALDTSTVSRDLERMIAKGWILSAPGEGRARSLDATSEGRDLLARVLPSWRGAQAQARTFLTAELAQRVVDRVDAIWKDPKS